MDDADQRPCAVNLNPDFLTQFPAQGGQNGFTRLRLTSWKLPEPAQVNPRGSLGQKNPVFRVPHHAHGNVC